MTNAAGPPLSEENLSLRIADLIATLDDWGEVRFADEENSSRRQFRAEVLMDAFGSPGVELIYDELYVESPAGYSLVEYCYNFIDRARDRFFGFHHQPIAGTTAVTHAHCRPLTSGGGHHLVAEWVDLLEAHYEFVRWAADPALFPECREMRTVR